MTRNLDKANINYGHELVYFESSLSRKAVKLSEGLDAVCVFVNDHRLMSFPNTGNDQVAMK